jgi:hypothetical protein
MTILTTEQVEATLLGAWRLVGWQSVAADGTTEDVLGSEATGQLMYTPDGRVSAQLVRGDLPRFAGDDWRQATPAEMVTAWPGYFGYFGRFTVDADAGTVIHHVESGWFPNLAGTDQVRHYRIDGSRLHLDADTAWGRVSIVWEKVRR